MQAKKLAERVKDEDNPEWTPEMFARALRFGDLPLEMQRGLTRRGRGPQKTPTKVSVTMRLSPDVVDGLRASGPGWQTRADVALRAWVRRHAKSSKAA